MVSSTILSIAFGLAVALLAIPSNLVPSVATSLPSTVPDTDILPTTSRACDGVDVPIPTLLFVASTCKVFVSTVSPPTNIALEVLLPLPTTVLRVSLLPAC